MRHDLKKAVASLRPRSPLSCVGEGPRTLAIEPPDGLIVSKCIAPLTGAIRGHRSCATCRGYFRLRCGPCKVSAAVER